MTLRVRPALLTLLAFVILQGASDILGSQIVPTAVKGGDDRNGAYDAVPNWWKPAPEHDATWTWGEVSGLAADTPDRIIVAIWGDRNRQGDERPSGSNYVVVVNRNG